MEVYGGLEMANAWVFCLDHTKGDGFDSPKVQKLTSNKGREKSENVPITDLGS